MNTISKFLLSAVIIAVFACVWFLLTQKNKSGGGCGCSGGCSGCSTPCGKQNTDDKR